MMNNNLSITIVAYHNYDDIKQAVGTIERYTPDKINKTIYIVDNSNLAMDEEPATASGFLNYLKQYSDVRYFDTRVNLGFGKGHNYVMPYLNSEYHAIVNPDIEFIEDAFSPIIDYMDNNLDVGMCIPNIIDQNKNRQLVYRKEVTVFDMFIRMFCKDLFPKRVKAHTLQDRDYTKPFQVPFGQGSFLVIRTELFKKINGFDDNFFMYLEDADLCKRVNQQSKLMYLPDATVVHRWEQGSHKSKKLFMIHVNSMLYYFKKWGYKLF